MSLGEYFGLKEESIGHPTIYLGGKMRLVTLDNGIKCWGYSSSQYVQNAIKNVEQHLHSRGAKLPSKAKAPIKSGYQPEVDITPALDTVNVAYYQSLIGILRWVVELGRVDIYCEVSMLCQLSVRPKTSPAIKTQQTSLILPARLQIRRSLVRLPCLVTVDA